MDNTIYNAIEKYFDILSKVGYKSYDEVYKLLYMIAIRDIYSDFIECITEDDDRLFKKTIYNIYGTSCMFPFPQLCGSDV